MIEVCYNNRHGAFELSQAAYRYLANLGYKQAQKVIDGKLSRDNFKISRHHPFLVKCVKALGSRVNDNEYSRIMISQVNSDRYIIDDEFGWEKVLSPKDIKWIVPNANPVREGSSKE